MIGTLKIRESEKKFPGKVGGKFVLAVQRTDGGLNERFDHWFRTTSGEVLREGRSIVLSTANSVYEFGELEGEGLAEYEAFLAECVYDRSRPKAEPQDSSRDSA